MNSICVIGVYFGKLPNYFPLWLKSAERNEKIDFYIVTDNKIDSLPGNVYVIDMTLAQMKSLAEEKLNMEICLEYPYKCCDFKPAYGVIFANFIKMYEYWGHCDFDLIWGDIYYFLNKYNYKKYDKFLDLGHLALYRNVKEVNSYYMEAGSVCGDYREVFSKNKSYAFDERNGIGQIFKINNHSIFEKRIYADISQIYHRYRLALKDVNYKHQAFYWEKGHIYREHYDGDKHQRDEFIYIHFKKRPNYELKEDFSEVDSFFVTNTGFIPRIGDGMLSMEDIQVLNYFPGRMYESMELLKFKVKGKLIALEAWLS